MTTIKFNDKGLYVQVDGAIARPNSPTIWKRGDKVRGSHPPGPDIYLRAGKRGSPGYRCEVWPIVDSAPFVKKQDEEVRKRKYSGELLPVEPTMRQPIMFKRKMPLMEIITNPRWGKTHAKPVMQVGASLCKFVDESTEGTEHHLEKPEELPTCMECKWLMSTVLLMYSDLPSGVAQELFRCANIVHDQEKHNH